MECLWAPRPFLSQLSRRSWPKLRWLLRVVSLQWSWRLTCVYFESDTKELVDSINGNIRRDDGVCILTRIRNYQQRWSPLPAKCLMLCAGLDGSDSSKLEVVL
ncbi:hypothetical protein Pyn_10114 [Prunus yedoensis var. nudiflora]|uniref:Uncharacterized protein n=1 Tax=Prunus yedoensis var. nudiflora TaxID=2094558 RepID=A0A314ZFQ9_PRUYE|nr:hypothetical protein Pyn_10114 [Prunus yedoensis var. nudiflora]